MQTFTKSASKKAVKEFVDEAKRVGYSVKGGISKAKLEVFTDECEQHPAGELVFKAIAPFPNSNFWLMTFNAEYWKEGATATA